MFTVVPLVFGKKTFVCIGNFGLQGLASSNVEYYPTLPYTFTLKMVIAMLAETLGNTQHSTRLIPESRSDTCKQDKNKSVFL
jgi:hypothetical protein